MTHPNPMINQHQWNILSKELQDEGSLAELLTSHGYSTEIKNIHMHFDNKQGIVFADCQFENVVFTGNIQDSHFQRTLLDKVIFENVDLTDSVFIHTSITDTSFIDAKMSLSLFYGSQVNSVQVYHSDLTESVFWDVKLNQSMFVDSKLDNVYDWGNSAHELHIVFNQESNDSYIFPEAARHMIEPVVALVTDPDWYSLPLRVIQQHDGRTVILDQNTPNNINDNQLAREVNQIINDIKQNGLKDVSIAQQVIHSDLPMIKAIYTMAYEVIQKVDAVWIPGGPDLHPEFYGEHNISSYHAESYYREILEFSLTDAAIQAGKTVMGVCHGSQLVNVYFGGTLHQHIPGHVGITPTLEVKTHAGLVGSVIEGPMKGPSVHHQGVKDLAYPLEVVATYDGVIKATQATDGKKVMLFQFHPENQVDHNSVNILQKFISLSSEEKTKSVAINISDVLSMDLTLDKCFSEPAHNPDYVIDTSSHSNQSDVAPSLIPVALPHIPVVEEFTI